VYISL